MAFPPCSPASISQGVPRQRRRSTTLLSRCRLVTSLFLYSGTWIWLVILLVGIAENRSNGG